MMANYMISAEHLNNLQLGFAAAFCFVFVFLYPLMVPHFITGDQAQNSTSLWHELTAEELSWLWCPWLCDTDALPSPWL